MEDAVFEDGYPKFFNKPVVPVWYCKQPGGPAKSSWPQVYWVT